MGEVAHGTTDRISVLDAATGGELRRIALQGPGTCDTDGDRRISTDRRHVLEGGGVRDPSSQTDVEMLRATDLTIGVAASVAVPLQDQSGNALVSGDTTSDDLVWVGPGTAPAGPPAVLVARGTSLLRMRDVVQDWWSTEPADRPSEPDQEVTADGRLIRYDMTNRSPVLFDERSGTQLGQAARGELTVEGDDVFAVDRTDAPCSVTLEKVAGSPPAESYRSSSDAGCGPCRKSTA